MAQLSDLLDRIHDEFPAVPKQMALRALSDATKEFFFRSHAWQETQTVIPIRPGASLYELDFDSGVQLAALKEVRFDGRLLTPMAAETHRRRGQQYPKGVPTGYIQWQTSHIELNLIPETAATLEVLAALTLRIGATNVNLPDHLMDEYGEYIASGAKSRLVRQANQPWYAPDAVLAYAGPFYQAITTAKTRALTGLGEAEMQVHMPSW